MSQSLLLKTEKVRIELQSPELTDPLSFSYAYRLNTNGTVFNQSKVVHLHKASKPDAGSKEDTITKEVLSSSISIANVLAHPDKRIST